MSVRKLYNTEIQQIPYIILESTVLSEMDPPADLDRGVHF